MMSFDEKLFENNFTFGFRAMVANNLLIATKTFEEFWVTNLSFLRNAEDLYGRLLSYAVNQQFINAATKSASAYFVKDIQLTRYKNKAVLLNTNDYTTSICRTEKPNKLPTKAKYKIELAQGNSNDYNQIELDFVKREAITADTKRFAIIGYRYINGQLLHMNILVPDSEYNGIIHNMDLLGSIREYKEYVPEKLVYDQVIDLKHDLAKKLNESKAKVIGD